MRAGESLRENRTSRDSASDTPQKIIVVLTWFALLGAMRTPSTGSGNRSRTVEYHEIFTRLINTAPHEINLEGFIDIQENGSSSLDGSRRAQRTFSNSLLLK
ncbi:MAG: hypothetical protein ACREA0_34145 [bacterium]